MESHPPAGLKYDLDIDISATSAAVIGWMFTWINMDALAPQNCRWCEAGSFDTWGHNNIKWTHTKPADIAAGVTAYGLAPLAAYGLDLFAACGNGNAAAFWEDALIITEAAAVASFAAQIVKIGAGRERPRARYGDKSGGGRDNNSFFSGHTTLAFSLAVSSGTVAGMRGYETAPWILGAGLAIAGITGYFSIASDRHYLTDVITGAGVGSAFGFGLPYLFHRSKGRDSRQTSASILPVEGGGLLAVSGGW